MDSNVGMTRDTLAVLIGQMLAAEIRTTPPPTDETGKWLYGSAGFTEPDEHGWMAPLPSARVWSPRALVFWQMAIRTDAQISAEQRRDPRHSLARWPSIEAAVRKLLSSSPREAGLKPLSVAARNDYRPELQ